MEQCKLMEEAVRLFDDYHLQNWQLVLKANIGNRLGQCDYRALAIALNEFYALNNPPELVIDTLRHEVAHALTPGHHHDDTWKLMALKLGCRIDTKWKAAGIILQPGKYKAICPTCQSIFYKYRKPKDLSGFFCPVCGPLKGRLRFIERENYEKRTNCTSKRQKTELSSG